MIASEGDVVQPGAAGALVAVIVHRPTLISRVAGKGHVFKAGTAGAVCGSG